MADTERKWAEFRETVESLCSTEMEKKRVEKEFTLFEERGREKYILLMADIMKEVNMRCTLRGCVSASYALEKYRTGDKTVQFPLILDGTCSRTLFNDALRMNFVLEHTSESRLRDEIRKLDDVLDPIVLSSGLFKDQRLYEDMTDDPLVINRKVEFLVLSSEPIDEDDMDLIVNETGKITPEEAERLGKYIVVKITTDLKRASGDL